MAKPPARSVWGAVLRNFINSLRPRQLSGDLIGTDYFGTKYYEIPANPSLGKRKASRWFEPKNKDFEQEIPAEWEAWLRGRRREPPGDDEIAKNLAIMQMKKINAREIEAKAGKPTPMKTGMESFPRRPEYEFVPGRADEEKNFSFPERSEYQLPLEDRGSERSSKSSVAQSSCEKKGENK